METISKYIPRSGISGLSGTSKNILIYIALILILYTGEAAAQCNMTISMFDEQFQMCLNDEYNCNRSFCIDMNSDQYCYIKNVDAEPFNYDSILHYFTFFVYASLFLISIFFIGGAVLMLSTKFL